MMSSHIDRCRKAIEFQSPDMIPMDLTDVPFLYNAYDTLDPRKVRVPEGAECFDSAWCTYHWTFDYCGKNEREEQLRRDEWGCLQTIPKDLNSAYTVVERPPLDSLEEVRTFPWPKPAVTDWFFESRKEIIETAYPDRFINGFLDPGPFLVAFELLGYEKLLYKLYEDIDFVKEVLSRIIAYQKALVPRFKEMGAHMITVIDEVAGSGGMMFSPETFRDHFLPMFEELFQEIHRNGMYVSILLDGNISDILGDLRKMPIDVQFFAQPLSTGIDVIADWYRGTRTVKVAVDMMETLATGTPEQIKNQVDEYVTKLRTDRGGLLFQALRWHRPEYRPERVRAQIEAMNCYREIH